MTIKEMILEYLIKNGYDGLFLENICSCKNDDIMPCGNCDSRCKAGYIVKCNGCDESDFCISKSKGCNCSKSTKEVNYEN